MARAKRVKRIPGDVVSIDLGDRTFAFARVLVEPTMAFYDLRLPMVSEVSTVVAAPVLFKVWVMNRAITHGIWPVIGHVELNDELLVNSRYRKLDRVSRKITIYEENTSREFPAESDDYKLLEAAAVWDPEHVVDRLRDYFAGVPNKWVRSLQF